MRKSLIETDSRSNFVLSELESFMTELASEEDLEETKGTIS